MGFLYHFVYSRWTDDMYIIIAVLIVSIYSNSQPKKNLSSYNTDDFTANITFSQNDRRRLSIYTDQKHSSKSHQEIAYILQMHCNWSW